MAIDIYKCLNPYYTGSYSMSKQIPLKDINDEGLNPYYTGSYSMRIGWTMFSREELIRS